MQCFSIVEQHFFGHVEQPHVHEEIVLVAHGLLKLLAILQFLFGTLLVLYPPVPILV